MRSSWTSSAACSPAMVLTSTGKKPDSATIAVLLRIESPNASISTEISAM